MKTNINLFYKISGLLTLSLVLGACGGEAEEPLIEPAPHFFGPNYSDPFFGDCQIPTGGTFNRSVIGTAQASVVLELDVIDQPNGTIQGVGRLTIPSMERLNGFNTPLQNYYQNYGYILDPVNNTYNGNFNGSNTSYTVCLSSVGLAGSLQQKGPYEELTLSLRGPAGLYSECGSTSGTVTPYLKNRRLLGQAYMGLPGHPVDQLSFAE